VTEQADMLERKLTVQELDLVLRRLHGLPTPPGVIQRVLSLTRPADVSDAADAGGGADDRLAAVLGCAPALTAKLLSLANRRPGAPVRTLGQALAALGPREVRSAALASPVLDDPDAAAGGPLDHHAFRLHCLAVALAAEMLARHAGTLVQPEQAFLCGLLHDLGKLVLDHCMPKTYRRVLAGAEGRTGGIAESERRIVGLDHCVIGRRLAEVWRLGESTCRVIWLSHQPVEALPESIPQADRAIVGVVHLADTIARELGLGFSGNFAFGRNSRQLARQVGVDSDAVDRVAGRLEAEVRARLGVAGLDRAPGPAGQGHQTLLLANAELGQLNEQLRDQGRRLARRAEGLRHLEGFLSELRPDATVWDVLVHVAEVIPAAAGVGARPRGPVVAYAIGDDLTGVSAVRCDGSGERAMRTFARRRGGQSPPGPPVGRAGANVLDDVLADTDELNEWVDLSACRHLPLTCAGAWVGGVLYSPPPAAGDEDARSESIDTLAAAMALGLAMVQGRREAVLLSEQFAAASQDLAAAQNTLAEAKTLAAVGRMAAGAAHELNNPLAVISGRAQLMREKADTPDQRQTWRLIAEQAQRLSDVISELMEFASPPESRKSAWDVPALLSDSVGDYRRWAEQTKASPVRVDIETGRDVPAALADADQIRAVIVELLCNSSRAVGPDGRIRLAAEHDEANEAVLLTVRDDGSGMDTQTLADAFTPFFSSHQAGRRRGLGLPRAKRYVENNGGRIWVRSQPGEGTTVYVQLPRATGTWGG